MADLGAIDSVGESIALLLRTRRALLAGAVPIVAEIRHDPLGALTGDAPLGNGLSIVCHHIGYADLRVAQAPGRADGIALEFGYIVTCRAASVAEETASLAWAMLELHRAPVLDHRLLTAAGGWAEQEMVQVIPEHSTPDLMRQVWAGFRQPVRLSALFGARVVRIDRGACGA